uniref:Uncharacterized protein n=1 Tax=Tanacetum cinerariifolium TaxID=118510 RepID=A0A699UP84_TANCI|nr:hypothetical protein [Tanacetum cinerariifolium]
MPEFALALGAVKQKAVASDFIKALSTKKQQRHDDTIGAAGTIKASLREVNRAPPTSLPSFRTAGGKTDLR